MAGLINIAEKYSQSRYSVCTEVVENLHGVSVNHRFLTQLLVPVVLLVVLPVELLVLRLLVKIKLGRSPCRFFQIAVPLSHWSSYWYVQ